MEYDKIILGIDPGTTIMGYGIIGIQKRKAVLITLGVIDLKKFSDHYLKLQKIFERVLSLIDNFHPDDLAIEAPFYGKNVQSMLKLGRAQGAAISAALYRQVPIHEYAPRKIKMAITGMGSASKEQVAGFLKAEFNFDYSGAPLDATDGLAAAVCHFYQNRFGDSGASFNSWKDFANKNPGRVK